MPNSSAADLRQPGTANSPLPPGLTAIALASTGLHPDDIPAVTAEEAAKLGIFDLTIYLADLEQRSLIPMPPPDGPFLEPLAIDSTVAGRAYRTERPVVMPEERGNGTPQDAGRTAWLPLLDSAERLGVIFARTSVEIDQELLATCEAVANLVAELIANKAAYGDVITRTRRTQDVTMAAELRWSMLPPLTYTGRNLTISGIVEPAYEIAGDSFDYAVNGDTAHVAILDAMGHGVEAARIANLAVAAYRHSRRRDLGTVDTYKFMDQILADQFGPERFATAQLATLTLSTGQLCWLNAGHPPPMVIRRGHRVDLSSDVCLPVGLAGATVADAKLAEAYLEPGDLVLFFTDGVVEARSAGGDEFGRERLADLTERAAAAEQTPAETLRLVGHAVLEHQIGVLQDDATLLLLAWHGPPAPLRSAGS